GAGEGVAADGPVVEVPDVVGREIGDVGPYTRGRVGARVGDGPGDVDRVARTGRRRRGDRADLQIGRRRLIDQQRHGGRAGVVGLAVLLGDAAARVVDRRAVGVDEDVPRTRQVARRRDSDSVRVRRPGREATDVLGAGQIDVGVAEGRVARQEDVIVP